MANEELNGLISQLGDIGTLIEQFSEIASEMKSAMNTAVNGLNKEKSDIEKTVKEITAASSKWESKITSVSKDVNDVSGKILSLNSSISNINKLMDEKIQPVKDYSEVCTSIIGALNRMSDSFEKLLDNIKGMVLPSDIVDKLNRIEQDSKIREQRDKQMAEEIAMILAKVSKLEDTPIPTAETEDVVS